MKHNKLLVSVVMVTYNQEKFIEAAIKSVLMQRCTFSFNLIISDDCSLDSTYEICKNYAEKYPDIIVLRRNDENLGVFVNYQKCFDHCDSEYIALLEGDDYWIDEEKLQKQVSVISKSEKIGLIHSDYSIFNENTQQYARTSNFLKSKSLRNQGKGYSKDVLLHNFICPCTALFRSSSLKLINFEYFEGKNVTTIDFILWLAIAEESEIAYIKDITAVYRVSSGSISNSNQFEKIENFYLTKLQIASYFIEKKPSKYTSLKKIRSMYSTFLMLKAIKMKNYKKAASYFRHISLQAILSTVYSYKLHKV